MKISVLLLSRNRPEQMTGVIAAMRALAVGEVEYLLRVDDDDNASIAAARNLEQAFGVRVFVGPRPKHLTAPMNEMAKEATGDFFLPAPDDLYPLAYGWDEMLKKGLEASGKPVSWIMSPTDSDPVFPFISRKWYEAAGNKLFVERFPFWFADTWLVETLMFVFGEPRLVGAPVFFGGKRGTTQRLRDLDFWAKVFIGGRSERMADAMNIAMKLGVFDQAAVFRVKTHLDSGDADWLKHMAAIEAKFADPNPPSAEYIACKAEEEWRQRPQAFADQFMVKEVAA